MPEQCLVLSRCLKFRNLNPSKLESFIKKPSSAVTTDGIIHFFIRTNSVRTSRQKLVKNRNKLWKLSGLEVSTQKITLTIIHIPFENMLTKRWPGIYILYYFILVEAIIRHQKLHLTCRELHSSCTACTSIKARSYFRC